MQALTSFCNYFIVALYVILFRLSIKNTPYFYRVLSKNVLEGDSLYATQRQYRLSLIQQPSCNTWLPRWRINDAVKSLNPVYTIAYQFVTCVTFVTNFIFFQKTFDILFLSLFLLPFVPSFLLPAAKSSPQKLCTE